MSEAPLPEETVDHRLERVRKQGDAPQLPIPSIWQPRYELKPYQKVGATHLAVKKRYILGDPTGSGKTPQELYAWALVRDLREKQGKHARLWVVTTKSATRQWEGEVHKFLMDQNVYRVPSETDKESRLAVIKDWVTDTHTYPVLIQNWTQFRDDWEEIKNKLHAENWMDEVHLVLDEVQKIKNPASKLGVQAREIVEKVDRVHGLTATLVKNKAHDAHAIVETLAPGTMSLLMFESLFCIKKKQMVKQRGRRFYIMKVTGYHSLEKFRETIAPVYLGRTDDEIEGQRPKVVFMKRTVVAKSKQRKIYNAAEQGLLVNTESESAAAAALQHAMQAAAAPEIFLSLPEYPFSVKPDHNAKAELLRELLEDEDEIGNEPMVIYSPLETIVTAYMEILKDLNPVRITGRESDDEREDARVRFQEGKTNICMITNAGSEALNLQRGKHLVFLSRPWDPGTYTQIIGRIRRFGSTHEHVKVWHLDLEDSIDEFIDAVLSEKFGPVEDITQNASLIPEDEVLPKDIAEFARRRRLKERA